VFPYVNKDAMKLHLEAISSQVPEGRHAFVVVDGASWHQEDLNLSNVTLLKLPPYSPQLNPVERIWEWLKQKWLSNRSYKNYKEIVDACCEAWNKFLTEPSIIPKMCSRQWASIKKLKTKSTTTAAVA
jgi:transposase